MSTTGVSRAQPGDRPCASTLDRSNRSQAFEVEVGLTDRGTQVGERESFIRKKCP